MKTPERVVLWASAVLVTIALTWPIAARPGSVGRLDNGDARYSIWNVAWVARALTTDPWSLYDANIFSPFRNTLAYSEPNLLAGAMAVPAWAATNDPHVASNWVIFWSFVLSIVTTYLLVRRLSGDWFGAAIAAVSFAFCPFVFSHLAHVQLLLTFTLPLVLFAMHAYVDAPAPRRAVWLALALALSGLACGYYVVFAAIAAGLGVVWFATANGRWRDWRYWAMAAGAAGLAFLLLWPTFAPFTQTEFGRRANDAQLFSANWQAYFASPAILNRWLLDLLGHGTWREVLFPGWLPLVFGAAAVGLAIGARGGTPGAPGRRLVGFYLALGGFAVWASLGPSAGLYTVLQDTVPFFTLLRASARFGIVTTLALAILGGLGAAAVARRMSDRLRPTLMACTLAFSFIAANVGDLHFSDVPPVPEADRRLAWMPRAPVVAFPFFTHASERSRHTEYMMWSTHHWQPLINGYSDHIPEKTLRYSTALSTFPSLNAWIAMREFKVRYVLIRWNSYDPSERDRLMRLVKEQEEFLRPLVDDGNVALFEVIGSPLPAAGPTTSGS